MVSSDDEGERPGLDLVAVRTTDDLAEAELLRAALESEGIQAFVQGAQHHATLGILGGHIPLRVLVPQSRLAEARELLEALEARGATIDDADAPEGLGDPAEGDDEPGAGGPYRARPAARVEDDAPPARLRRVAVMAAFFLPGGANFYARQTIVGLFLGSVWLAFLFSFGGLAMAVVHPLVVVADIVTGLAAVRRCNSGQPASTGRQIAIGLVLWGVVGGAGGVTVAALDLDHPAPPPSSPFRRMQRAMFPFDR